MNMHKALEADMANETVISILQTSARAANANDRVWELVRGVKAEN